MAGPGKPGQLLEVDRVVLVSLFAKQLDTRDLLAVATDGSRDLNELATALLALEIEVVKGVDGLALALLTLIDVDAHNVELVVLQMAQNVRDFANLV